MVSRNLDIRDEIVNGTTGELKIISYNFNNLPKTIWFDFGNYNEVGSATRTTNSNLYLTENINDRNLTPIFRKTFPVSSKKHKNSFMRNNFPILPAHSLTIMKAQGSTFEEITVTIHNKMQIAHFYVCFSRPTTLLFKFIGLFVYLSKFNQSCLS